MAQKRILFISGSLEPTRDGVGDYTRTLASSCCKIGCESFTMSLREVYLNRPIQEVQCGIRTLRLPDAINNIYYQKKALAWAKEIKPDWISLQFVCYSFHPKGLCWKMIPFVNALRKIAPLHIMAHELWIGPHAEAPFKEKLIGFAQRQLVTRIYKKAECIHTQCAPYQYLLQQQGIEAKLLPIFSNLKIAQGHGREWLLNFIKERFSIKNIENSLFFGFFGSLYRGFPSDTLHDQLAALATASSSPIIALSFGHLGASAATWENFSKHSQRRVKTIKMPILNDEELSLGLQGLNAGLITTPLSLLEKSGSAATFYSHGIPIIAIRDDVHFKNYTHNPHPFGAVILKDYQPSPYLPPTPRAEHTPLLIAEKFLQDLR
jgi:hypothetical protein